MGCAGLAGLLCPVTGCGRASYQDTQNRGPAPISHLPHPLSQGSGQPPFLYDSAYFYSNKRKDVQKAMAYDLIRIFEQNPDKTYTAKELKDLIDAYISGLKQ